MGKRVSKEKERKKTSQTWANIRSNIVNLLWRKYDFTIDRMGLLHRITTI